jgi:hypothetical protein
MSFPNVLVTAHQAFLLMKYTNSYNYFENVSDLITKNDIDNKAALLN